MFYLADAAFILVFFFFLGLFGCAVSARRPWLEVLTLAATAWLGFYGFALWCLGSLGFFQPIPLFGLFALGSLGIIGWKRANVAANLGRIKASIKGLRLPEGMLVVYVIATTLLMLLLALVPPSSTDYDSLVYHLSVPAEYLRAGRIIELPYDHHSYFPLLVEMLFGLGLALRGPVLAKLFSWLMLPLGAALLAAIGRRAYNRKAGLIAAALYVSLPMAQGEAITAYIDLGFSAYAWAAVLAFLVGTTPRKVKGDSETETYPGTDWREYALCGACCGFCLGAKYFGALIFGFLGLWLLGAPLRKQKIALKPMATFAAFALLIGAPVYLRNIAWTGSPVFPFAYGLFGGRGWTAEMAKLYNDDLAYFGFGKSPLDILLLPFRLAMTPLNVGVLDQKLKGIPSWPLGTGFVDAKAHSGLFDVPDPSILFQMFPGPLLLALGVPALLARDKTPSVRLLAIMFGFLWFVWAVSSQQIRYLFPALGILCVVCGWGVARYARQMPISRIVGALCVIGWLLLAPLVTLHRANNSMAVLLGAETPDQYLRRTFAAYDAMEWIRANTPEQAKFAVYGEPRDYYLPRPYFWADDAHNNLVDYPNITTPRQLADALKKLGATHLLVDTIKERRAFGPPEPLFTQLVNEGDAQQLYEAHGFAVYSLN